jgi:hypothetical protein
MTPRGSVLIVSPDNRSRLEIKPRFLCGIQ